MCYLMDIPSDGDWHVIGAKPLIDNENVMHHTLVSLCTDEQGMCNVTVMQGQMHLIVTTSTRFQFPPSQAQSIIYSIPYDLLFT